MASKTLSNDQHRLLRRVKKVAYLIGLFLAMTIICLPWSVDRAVLAAPTGRNYGKAAGLDSAGNHA